MKKMTCNQLGGACDKVFSAETFDKIAAMSKKHGMEMFVKRDAAHLKAIGKMRQLMKTPGAMKEWFESKRKEFEVLSDS